MTKENFTSTSRQSLAGTWADQSDCCSYELPAKGSDSGRLVFAAGGTLLAFLLLSNCRSRRKRAKSRRWGEESASTMPKEVGLEGSVAKSGQAGALSIVDRAPSWILRVYSRFLGSNWFQAHGDQLTEEVPRREPWPAQVNSVNAHNSCRLAHSADAENDGQSKSPGAPRHVAVIMDGNRRFGRVKYRDPLKGHSDGGKKLAEFLQWCVEGGVEMATAFAFSTENWKRDAREVVVLMDLICKSCGELMEDAVKKNIRIRVLASDKAKLPERVLTSIRKAEDETRGCTGFQFNICLSYGARQEIANACRRIAEDVASGATSLSMVDETTVAGHLLTAGLPDPDLLIRTSGEKRMAYTELFFIDKLWPDVTHDDVLEVFEAYKIRERRYGC